MPGGDKKETEEEKKQRIKEELKGKKYTIKIPEEKITAKRDNLRIAEKPRAEIKLTAKGGKVISPIKVSDKKCFCNRDFTVEELKKIILMFRDSSIGENTTDIWGGLYKSTPCKIDDKSWSSFTKEINKMINSYNINTCIRKIHFFAQALAETGTFKISYEGRISDKLVYDPWRGRGILQLTHKDSYQRYAKYSVGKGFIQSESELMNNPNLISDKLNLAIDSGGWEWNIDKTAHYESQTNKEKFKEILDKSLNKLADYGWTYRYRISKLLNGGNNGWEERIIYYLTLEKYFNYQEICANRSKEIKSQFQDSVVVEGKNITSKEEMLKEYNAKIDKYLANSKNIK